MPKCLRTHCNSIEYLVSNTAEGSNKDECSDFAVVHVVLCIVRNPEKSFISTLQTV